MAKDDDEFSRLLAETEAALAGRPAASAATPAATPGAAPAVREAGRFETSIRTSAISGGVAAALVFLVFAILPFFGAFSGAAGAFVATFFIVLAQRVFRRKG